MSPLAIFDLDHTLLSGDSDVLWCDFLLHQGLLEETFRARNAEMERRYKLGEISPVEFCGFFVSTLAGKTPASWQPWRERFLQEVIRPRLPAAARALVQQHRDAGHTLVMSTATCRVLTELTARDLGIEHLIATEVELAQGLYSGRLEGVPNMREGKVTRMLDWLDARGAPHAVLADAHFYGDSINDLPLLNAVGYPVAVDPDARLLSEATARGWRVLGLAR